MRLSPVRFNVAALFVLALVAVAQTSPVVGPIDDAAAQAFFQRFSKWQLLLIPAVTVIVAGVKWAVPKIPSQLLPIIAPFVGVILDYVGSKFGLWSGNAAAGAIMGGLGTWFNEAQSQTRELVANSNTDTPATPPKP